MRSDSREYLQVTVTADVDLVDQVVQIAAQPFDSTADPAWNTAVWIGDHGTTRTAQILIGPGGGPSIGVLPVGTYRALVRVTDNPEAPVVQAFTFTVR